MINKILNINYVGSGDKFITAVNPKDIDKRVLDLLTQEITINDLNQKQLVDWTFEELQLWAEHLMRRQFSSSDISFVDLSWAICKKVTAWQLQKCILDHESVEA